MSTRCVITFRDDFGRHSIYQHHDGYPEGDHGVVSAIAGALRGGKAWEAPRWEACEFAAAYIATHKSGPGNLRLTSGPAKHGDLSYAYTVSVGVTPAGKGLRVTWRGGDAFIPFAAGGQQ